MSEINKDAFVITKDGLEKSVKEWVEFLKNEKNHMGRCFTSGMIHQYTRKRKHGFSYKCYEDLPGEIWKPIQDSETSMGFWEISNMNRVKYNTKHASNVIEGIKLGLKDGYPVIMIKKIQYKCHILAFATFYPDEYAAMKIGEMILHKNDDKMDFRPKMLRIGTASDNIIDAYNNGKRDAAKTSRKKCASYINCELEKVHVSQGDAAEYLKSNGYPNATQSNISLALRGYDKGKNYIRYNRTWKTV